MTTRGSRWAAFPLACLIFALICIAPARAGGDLGGSGKFTGWWELGGYYGTDDASRGEAVLFTPLMQSATTLFFLDARGKLFEDDVQEGNIALGYRQMMPSGWNLGLWGGWDIRDTTNDNTFNQISFGLEALSERYDLRVNGYVPLEDSETVTNTNSFDALLQGNNIFVQQTNTLIRELAFYGVDAEFGVLLFGGNRGGGGGLKGAPAPSKRHELRAYAGGFWFDHDDADEAIAGPKGRLEYRINDVVSGLPGSRLTLESEFSYDEVRDTKFEIGARLRIPFGSRGSDAASRTAALTGQELRMIEGLERDTDIVTDEQTDTTITTEGAIDDATDVALNAVSFAQSASAFKKAVDAGGNRLIILRKGEQKIDVSSTEGQQLQDNQTVQGGASTILIRGKTSGQVVPFTAPGKRPTVFTDDGNINTGAITLANNAHVAGLNIRGAGDQNTFLFGNSGLRQNPNQGHDNVVIEQMDIQKLGYHGIFFEDGNSNVRITDSEISDLYVDGVRFGDNSRNIFVDQLNINGIGGIGIRNSDFGRNVEIRNSTVNDAGVGILIGSENRDVGIHDVRITDTNVAQGILFNDFNRNVSISDVVIRNTAQQGIGFSNSNRNVSLQSVDVANTGAGGILFGFVNENVSIRDSVVKNTGANGISFEDQNAKLTLQNIQIEDAGSAGLSLISQNTDVVINQVTIADAGQDGIFIDDDNRNFTFKNVVVKRNGAGNAIEFDNDNRNFLFDGILTEDTDEDGIDFGSRNIDVTIRNARFINPGRDGIEFLGDNQNITIVDTEIINPDEEGIDISSDNVNVEIADTVIRGGAQGMLDGIEITNGNSAFTIRNIEITDAQQTGIQIFDNNTDVQIANATITNPGSVGIVLGDNNTDITIQDSSTTGGLASGISMATLNNVTVQNVEITDSAYGLQLNSGLNVVSVLNSVISNTAFAGIETNGNSNDLNVQGTEIVNSGGDGIEINGTANLIDLNATTFSGSFGNNVIRLTNSNTLSGSGNIFIGTFGNQFCNSGAQTGSIGFDVGPQATCP